MKKELIKNLSWWSGVITMGVVIGMSLQFVRAWTEPVSSPPNGNLGAPINTSVNAQLKSGPLGVNSIIRGYSHLYVDGSLGIGLGEAEIPSEKLDVVGNIVASGDVCNGDNECVGDGGAALPTTCTNGQTISYNVANEAWACANNPIVMGNCAVGSFVSEIKIDGSVVCGEDEGGTVTPVVCPCDGSACGAQKTEGGECCSLYYTCTMGGWIFIGDSGSCGCP